MGRIILFVLLAILGFIGAIAVPLAVSGNLNGDGINRLLGREGDSPRMMQVEDELGPLAQKLQEREQSLDDYSTELDERASRLDQREREIDDTLEQLEEIQAQVSEQMDALDAERLDRLQKLADMVGAMDPREAAEDLEALTPEDAAEVLILLKGRTAGSILDEMEHRKRVQVHQILQARRY